MILGVGSVFVANPAMAQLYRVGAFHWRHWIQLGGAGLFANYLGTSASVYAMGNPTAYHHHWMAYYYVKSCNRWEGRKILKNKPLIY